MECSSKVIGMLFVERETTSQGRTKLCVAIIAEIPAQVYKSHQFGIPLKKECNHQQFTSTQTNSHVHKLI